MTCSFSEKNFKSCEFCLLYWSCIKMKKLLAVDQSTKKPVKLYKKKNQLVGDEKTALNVSRIYWIVDALDLKAMINHYYFGKKILSRGAQLCYTRKKFAEKILKK